MANTHPLVRWDGLEGVSCGAWNLRVLRLTVARSRKDVRHKRCLPKASVPTVDSGEGCYRTESSVLRTAVRGGTVGRFVPGRERAEWMTRWVGLEETRAG